MSSSLFSLKWLGLSLTPRFSAVEAGWRGISTALAVSRRSEPGAAHGETAKAVDGLPLRYFTPLKQGVNERSRRVQSTSIQPKTARNQPTRAWDGPERRHVAGLRRSNSLRTFDAVENAGAGSAEVLECSSGGSPMLQHSTTPFGVPLSSTSRRNTTLGSGCLRLSRQHAGAPAFQVSNARAWANSDGIGGGRTRGHS